MGQEFDWSVSDRSGRECRARGGVSLPSVSVYRATGRRSHRTHPVSRFRRRLERRRYEHLRASACFPPLGWFSCTAPGADVPSSVCFSLTAPTINRLLAVPAVIQIPPLTASQADSFRGKSPLGWRAPTFAEIRSALHFRPRQSLPPFSNED